EHVAKLVGPALKSGKTVISDRYSDSRYAYQGITLKNRIKDPLAWVRDLHRGWTIVPDLTLLFDISPKTAIERCGNRGDKTKFEKIEFLAGVKDIFHTLAAEEPKRFVLIDAARPAAEVEAEVVEIILEFLER
ncbi:MAG: dTMP kinase, partial [Methanosarcinaceae archaeon]|nr:dTMP kinase [Methanosarcinaceae archaeon]